MEEMPQQPVPQPTPTVSVLGSPKKSSPLVLALVVGLVAAVVFGGGGYYLGKMQQVKPVAMEKSTPPAPTAPPAKPTLTKSEYLDSLISYDLPIGWKKDTTSVSTGGAYGPAIEISNPGYDENGGVYILITSFTNPALTTDEPAIAQLMKKIKPTAGVDGEVKEITVGGMQAVYLKYGVGESYYVLQDHDKYTWNIIISYNNKKDHTNDLAMKTKYQPDVDKFIQSFRFK